MSTFLLGRLHAGTIIMRNIFVTGATGFIGTALVREMIRRELHVKCLVRTAAGRNEWPSKLVQPIVGRLEEPESYAHALQGCDTVVHLAARLHAPRQDELFRIKVAGTAGLCSNCRTLKAPPHLIYISSLAAAGPTPNGKPYREETDQPSLVSNYGRSKFLGEAKLRQHSAEMPISILRPGIVYGPGDTNFARLFRAIRRTRVQVVVGFRTPPLSLLYVDDLVSLVVDRAAQFERLPSESTENFSSQGVYFVCDDSEFPNYWELGRRIGKSMDQSVFVWPIWRWVGFTTGATTQLFHRLKGSSSVLNVDKVREAVARSWASSSQKARTQLGFHPPKSLDVRLKETAHGFRERGWI